TKSNFLAAAAILGALIDGLGQPMITKQPTNQSVSLGASAKFQVSATTTNPPLSFKWRFNEAELGGKTNFSLTLMNIQTSDAGGYDVEVADISGSATSQVAHLEVDTTFTKITAGPIVTDKGYSAGGTWGDFNNDGFL